MLLAAYCSSFLGRSGNIFLTEYITLALLLITGGGKGGGGEVGKPHSPAECLAKSRELWGGGGLLKADSNNINFL